MSRLWNSQSIVNKLKYFQSYIFSSQLQIIALMETWLSTSVLDNQINPLGYSVNRRLSCALIT